MRNAGHAALEGELRRFGCPARVIAGEGGLRFEIFDLLGGHVLRSRAGCGGGSGIVGFEVDGEVGICSRRARRPPSG